MSDEKYLITKKDLDMIRLKVQWAFERLFEDKIQSQQTVNRLNAVDQNQDDIDVLQDFLEALKIDYSFLLNEHKKIRADFFDWSERR